MGIFDSLGNFASRIVRDVSKGTGWIGETVGNIAGGAWSSFTNPGFDLPSTGGLAGRVGGLIGEVGEATLGSLIGTAEPMTTTTSGWPTGGIPMPGRGYETTQIRPPGYQRGFLPGTEQRYPIEMPMGGGAMQQQAVALPGGALIGGLLRNLPGVLGGAAIGYQAGSEGQSIADLPYGGVMFRQTACGIRAKSLVEVVNPYTLKKSWYRNVGRPILFSGDLRACKRVRKIAGRARRARGR